ncbi:lytic transglycosylase domain-containing protein [Limnobacter humi]|uniref:Lytic transglycosylase domain-containing protein n=1 Tax=Limnobacter humi TaxID=1778671 RepID=A0ABT1WDU8_9BURK|nr:lytic transglycosylase domain-containing protein [Limnobacter humi]MCQ8895697.1 lytic transglycosylase domain-containing protein [Limnobacter humi]
MEEAVATARRLEKEGFNFSLGLSQVNRHNLAKYGESYASIFEPCRNLRTGAAILVDCYAKATTKDMGEQVALRAALSCYYSGNFIRGFKPDSPGQPSYVQKVVDTALNNNRPVVLKIQPISSSSDEIEVRKTTQPGSTQRNDSDSKPWVIFKQSPPSTPQTQSPKDTTVRVKPVVTKTHSRSNFVQILE